MVSGEETFAAGGQALPLDFARAAPHYRGAVHGSGDVRCFHSFASKIADREKPCAGAF
jgi:hypothetical protein